ncbi:dTMP kinase [Humisphaera borealis]|uniref:Thymidylate kinase n=1 Tax=Humisphaera borealis TaxID=2807512 RepID=A0A7M2WQH5_9BACT|nr:dTMP kinase [Humisphaera borealis]QOV87494.1 dTMP kinase [Humisphaera borealis]
MESLRGKFIVFDGTEGCGKSTQAALLRSRLATEGFPEDDVLLVRDPGATRIGEMIRQILLDPQNNEMGMRCEMLLYMAARAQMMHQTILPALAAGKLVLSDRFVSSTLAYQLGGDGLTAAEIRAVAGIAIKDRWPDLTVILDMPADASMRRVKPKALSVTLFGEVPEIVDKDRIERRPMEYHEQVRRNYLSQVDADPSRYRVINGAREKDIVHEDVWRGVRSK